LQFADQVLALSAEGGLNPNVQAASFCHRGWCLAVLGHPDDGIPLLTTGLADLRQVGYIVDMPGHLTRLAEAYGVAGQPEVALEHLAEAERLAETTQVRWVQAETRRLRGNLQMMSTGDRVAAEASFRDAIAVAQCQGAKLFELRASTSLARLWRDRGKRTEADELLAPVYAWFTEGFDAPDLIEAKALLAELR
jgi:predicted ATPase